MVCRLLVPVVSVAADHRLLAHGLQQLWHKGLATTQHVESSQTRDRTGSPGPEG